MIDRRRTLLEAYRDGELSWLGRWRVQRWLRRDPAVQRQLAALDALGELLNDVDAEGPAPDLWPAIRLRLAAADVYSEARAPAPFWRRGAGYLAAGAVAASAAALALMLAGEEPVPSAGSPGAVRWLDSRGHPMMVLRDDSAATIIWVPEQAS
jgi:anti-sigma factor RsiW